LKTSGSSSRSATRRRPLALSDRKEEILVVHRLNVPATLNVTLLSTNAIENVIRNWREQTET
jgi:hypothetical protein